MSSDEDDEAELKGPFTEKDLCAGGLLTLEEAAELKQYGALLRMLKKIN